VLKTEMHKSPHLGVAAFAGAIATALTPPTIVNVATAASSFLLVDSAWVGDGGIMRCSFQRA
jgi:hypothetical protein